MTAHQTRQSELERENQALRLELERATRRRKRYSALLGRLRSGELLIHDAFEQAPVGIALAGIDGVVSRVNRRLCRIAGREPAELLGRPLDAIMHPEDREPEHRERLIEGSIGEYRLHQRCLRPDGETTWVGATYSLSRDGRGRPRHVICAVEDITGDRDRLEALMVSERALQQANLQIYDILAHVQDGFIAVDRQWRIIFANDAAARILNAGGKRLAGRSLLEIRPEGCCAGLQRHLQQAMEGRGVLFEEHDERLGRWFECRAYPTPDGIACFMTDMTERRRAEQELRELAESLEEKVRRRTAELERRAAQLRAMALELSKAEDRERRRLAHVLHDGLQQLLVSARFSSETLRARTGDPRVLEVVAQLDQALNQAIDASRSLSHELSPPILSHGGLAAAIEWLAARMREKFNLEVELTADEAGIGGCARGEELRGFLFQAVREMLFNVVKHAGVDRARVRLRRHGGRLLIEVCDDGKGFDSMAWAANPTSFGLFSISERVMLLGGRLEVDSAPGRGSRFTLSLPCRCEERLTA